MKKLLIILPLLFCLGGKTEIPESYCAEMFVFTFDKFDTHMKEVEAFISDWHSDVKERFKNKALAFAPMIVGEARSYQDFEVIDPILISIIIAYEANFDSKAIGKKGEVGLMQTL